MTPSHETIPRPTRLPLSFVGAALLAFAALYLTGGRFFVMPILAALLVVAQITGPRIPDNKILAWVIRLALWGIIIALGPERRTTGFSIFFEPDYVHMFGYLCAAELTLRAWLRPSTSRGEFLLITALIMTAASNTFTGNHIQYLAPVYALLTVLCLRTFIRPEGPMTSTRRPPLVVMRSMLVLLAIAIGFTAVYAVNEYEHQLITWAVNTFKGRRTTTQSQIGLSATPRLQRVWNPQPSLARVLTIDGTRSAHHLRVIAYDDFDGTHWRPLPTDRAFRSHATPRPVEADASARLRITRYQATLDLLPTPLEVLSIEADAPIEIDALDTLRAEDLPIRTTYNVALRSRGILPLPDAPMHGREARATKDLSDDQRTRALALPEIDASIIALARDVAGEAEPAIRAVHIAQHLRSNHEYSLEYDPGDADPLTDFIMNRRAAHCQYFAAAMVVMARAVDVPARYVSGFLAHEVDGERIVVRDRDAHAWAECWIDGVGWVTFDATPASGLPDQIFPEPSRWRRMWERLQDLPAAVRDYFADPARQAMMLMVGVPIVGVVLLWFLVRGWWRLKPQARDREYATPSEDLVAVGRRFERWMKRRGVSCPGNITWREHLQSLARQSPRPIEVDSPLRFVDMYEEARFGNANGAVQEQLQELIGKLDS